MVRQGFGIAGIAAIAAACSSSSGSAVATPTLAENGTCRLWMNDEDCAGQASAKHHWLCDTKANASSGCTGFGNFSVEFCCPALCLHYAPGDSTCSSATSAATPRSYVCDSTATPPAGCGEQPKYNGYGRGYCCP